MPAFQNFSISHQFSHLQSWKHLPLIPWVGVKKPCSAKQVWSLQLNVGFWSGRGRRLLSSPLRREVCVKLSTWDPARLGSSPIGGEITSKILIGLCDKPRQYCMNTKRYSFRQLKYPASSQLFQIPVSTNSPNPLFITGEELWLARCRGFEDLIKADSHSQLSFQAVLMAPSFFPSKLLKKKGQHAPSL